MDRILIKDLEVFCRVGVPDEERRAAQRLLLTVELEHNFTAAAKSDNLANTINYFAVSQRLLSFGKDREWKLIETLAMEIAETILREFGPAAVEVEVKKFIIPQAAYVSVRTIRRR
ncbi:MAG TPA: dihydroneopterin aldolase [Verrucomicrobiae bacterium]|jgi:FolB domain-containing protein